MCGGGCEMSPSSKMFGLPKRARLAVQKLLIISLLLASCNSSEANNGEEASRGRRSIGDGSADDDFYGAELPDAAAGASRPLALTAAASSAAGSGGGGGGGEKPRLIPLVASDSGYSENSSVNILCTVSQGHHETLIFDWFKDGQQLGLGGPEADSTALVGPQIESQPDHSLLRISRVKSQHAGRYTCSAKNQFGQDASSVNLAVNGNYSA